MSQAAETSPVPSIGYRPLESKTISSHTLDNGEQALATQQVKVEDMEELQQMEEELKDPYHDVQLLWTPFSRDWSNHGTK